MKHLLATLFVIGSLVEGFGQSTYFIKDQTNSDPVPFSKVVPNSGQPFITDIDGAFQLKDSAVISLQITSFGFRDTLILLADIKNFQIKLTPLAKEIEEVVIHPGENPAHRIMNLVIANRKKNNPTDNDAFRLETYSKFVFDMNQDALASIPDSTKDTVLMKIKQFFGSRHLLLIESASKRTFIPPTRDREEIIAYKVSGFNDPMFSTFANEMQSFSFYENQFQLLGKTYINPIAFGGTNRYLFLLEDTTVIGSDTTFTISFRPKKGRNFDGLKGRLYINTKGYAVEKVITEPYVEDKSSSVKIVQEYSFVNGEKWFPSKLSTEISFQSAQISNKVKDSYIEAKGNTYVKNVEFNPKGMKKYTFDNASITTADDANDVTDKGWDSLRIYGISEKEKHTYQFMDSVSKKYNLNYKLALMKTLLEGKIPLGYFNAPLDRIYDFRTYEGNRLGLGLETSKKMMKKVMIGGYFAYGTKDLAWKYGGYSDIQVFKPKGVKLHFGYQHDIAERGGTSFQKEAFNLNSTEMYRRFFINKMDFQDLAEVALSGYATSNFKISLIGNYQRLYFTQGYGFNPTDLSVFHPNPNCDLAETKMEIKWNIREKVMQVGETRIASPSNYPKIALQVTKGWKGWAQSNYDYWRLYFEVGQDVSFLTVGKLSWKATAGKTIGDVPLFLQQVALGTGVNKSLSVKNTFETMRPSEFYSNQQVALFTRFSFQTIKTSLKWFKPQVGLHHAIGYGSMSKTYEHAMTFNTMQKGYYEGGLIVDKVYVSGAYGLGFGAFYRYGSYAFTDWQQNLFLKLTFSLNL